MSKFTDFINRINEWRDYFMTEERKKDLQSVLAAGKKVVAKLKKYHNDKIVSYDGEDAYYSDIDEYTDAVSADEVVYSESPAEKSEKAFGYYEKIMSKIDSIKDSIKGNDSVAEVVKKAENLFKGSDVLTKEQLEAELDKIMVELDDKLSVIAEKSAAAASSIEGLTEQSKSNYTNISTSVSEVSEKADGMLEIIAEVSSILKSSAPQIEEIREASIGIDKLTDSVFELKNTNIKVKNEIEEINKKIRFIKIWGIAASGVVAVIGAVAVAVAVIF